MRATRMSLVTALLAVATPALAAGREDTSGIFVWAFLGLCALIVAAQVIPALLMLVGAAKGLARGLKETEGEEAEARTR